MQSTFQVGDKAVHPAHGVGEVTAIERREIAGTTKAFYVLKIMDTGMKVMVPTAAVEGLRTVMPVSEAEKVLAVFRSAERAVGNGPWNRRQRAYNEMIRSGSPYEIAKVLRDLYRIKFADDKDLSYGERRLMDQARALLVKELALSKKVTEAEVEREIEAMFVGSAKAS
jgi:CarD family transcriptional regulator